MHERSAPGRSAENDLLPASLGALTALAVAALLVPLREVVGGTNVALVLVVVIVAAASIGGRLAGILTATAASLAFNFLYAPPYLTLRIHGSQDVITTVLLFVVGISVGEIVRYSRRFERVARRHRLDITDLHELSDMVRRNAPQFAVLDRANALLVRELGLLSCTFEPAAHAQSPVPVINHQGLVERGVSVAPLRHAPGGFELPSEGVAVPVEVDLDTLGQFVMVPAPGRGVSLLDRQLAVLVASIVAPALGSPTD
jgi:K+-sensing histidine kinase KdpD